MAVASDLEDVHRRTRTTLSFREQFADPGFGLAVAREGLEFAARIGSSAYGFLMVGNAVSCALRVGEWPWASDLLAEWLANEITGQFYLELYADRAVLTALTGGDPNPDVAEAERLLPGQNDPQYTSYVHWCRAWSALAGGRYEEAQRDAIEAANITPYFSAITLPIAARAALWRDDAAAASEILKRLADTLLTGQASRLDHESLRAGLAAREGRRTEAVAGYREVLRGWKQLGCDFDEALAVVDMATLLAPTEREMAEAPSLIAAAHEILVRLGARPFIARLDAGAPPASEATSSSRTEATMPVTA